MNGKLFLFVAASHFLQKISLYSPRNPKLLFQVPYAIDLVGNKPFIYSSDFPHEVNNETCKEEINEVRDNELITHEDKQAILFRNAQKPCHLSQIG